MDAFKYWFGFVADIVTVIGIIITVTQIIAIRRISMSTQKKINRTLSVSDISKCNEILREVNSKIRSDEFDKALQSLRDSKDILVKLQITIDRLNIGDNIEDVEYKFKKNIDNLRKIISDIEDNYQSPLLLNKSVLCQNVDETATFIVELHTHLQISQDLK